MCQQRFNPFRDKLRYTRLITSGNSERDLLYEEAQGIDHIVCGVHLLEAPQIQILLIPLFRDIQSGRTNPQSHQSQISAVNLISVYE